MLYVWSVTQTTANLLLLDNYDNSSWYMGSQQGAACSEMEDYGYIEISGLTPGTIYTYTAYAKDGCNAADRIASVEFVTKPAASTVTLTASDIRRQTSATLTIAGHTGSWWYRYRHPWSRNAVFSPCTATAGNTVHVSGLRGLGIYEIVAFGDSACTTAVATASIITLGLLPDTIKPTAVRLSLLNNGRREWWYQGDQGKAACTEAVGGESFVAGLDPETAYTYRAYYKTGCASEDEIGNVTFTTPAAGTTTLTVSAVTSTTATLTIADHAGDWWFKGNWHTCTAVASGTTAVNLTGLKAGISHHYRAYEQTGCHEAEEIARESWSALRLRASAVAATTATLRLRHYTGAWWHGSQNGGDCTPVAAGTTKIKLTELTPGTSYIRKAYSNSGCASADAIASATFTTLPAPPAPPAAPTGLTATAGDRAVTLAWTDPSDSGIERYEYQMRWTGFAWGEWTPVSGSDSDTTSHIVTDLTNGTEYRFHVRAVNAAGASVSAPNAPPWYVAATPATPLSPQTPSSVTVTRSDGALTATWPAVHGATSYHVTYTSDGGVSWSLAALNHPEATITISPADNDATYIVAVRARNAQGDSGWRNSPPAGPFTPPPPQTPSSVTVTRSDGALAATWPAVHGATSYHVTYTSDGGVSWSLAALNHPEATITISPADNDATYIVAVRARNAQGDSGWRNSPPAGPFTPPPPPQTPSSVTVTRSDGALAATWPAVHGATSYHVTYTSDGGVSWSLAALNHPEATITISPADNDATYIVGVRARNAQGDSGWRNSPPAGPFTPLSSAASSGATGAAMRLSASSRRMVNLSATPANLHGDAVAAPLLRFFSHATRHDTVSIEAFGTEHRFHPRAVNAADASGPAPNAPPWYVTVTPPGATVAAMRLVVTNSGRMVNLSTTPASLHGNAVAVPLLPAVSDRYMRRGLLRIVNRSARAGTVRIEAFDDDGKAYGPLGLSMDAAAAVTLTSADLELGNAAKGLANGIGPATAGHWRLRLASDLDIRAMAYVLHADGLLTTMHDMAPVGSNDSRVHRVATFDPGRGGRSLGLLRLVNPGPTTARATIMGTDDRGASPGSGVVVDVPAGGSTTLTSPDLGIGGTGGLWRLRVESPQPIRVMSLTQGPSGHLSNLSTVPANSYGNALVVPLLLSASDPHMRRGLLRIVNRSARAGTVRIEAFDDDGKAYGSLALPMDADAAVTLTSADIELGNAAKGLTDGIGPATAGHWRLRLVSDLDIRTMAYVLHSDGLLTAMHDIAPMHDAIHRLPILEAGHSLLRLVNLGAHQALVIFDGGLSSRPIAVVPIPGRSSIMLPTESLQERYGTPAGM